MSKEKPKTTRRGRAGDSGRFVPIPYAERHPKTTVVETILLPKKHKK